MYAAYYELKEDPFRLSPDHSFCYRHPNFADCRAYLKNALDAGENCVLLTALPGMGKTMLVNDLLTEYGPPRYQLATLVSTQLDTPELLRSIAYGFGLGVGDLDPGTAVQLLEQHFLQCQQNDCQPLLAIDEAQNLQLEVLQELDKLAKAPVEGNPLLQILLVAQSKMQQRLEPSLFETLLGCAATHLDPLNAAQTADYIVHRLQIAGWSQHPRIEKSVIPVVHSTCQGVPRTINQFCDRLLLLGAMENKGVLTEKDARAVYQEMLDEELCVTPPHTEQPAYLGFLNEDATEFLAEPAGDSNRAEHSQGENRDTLTLDLKGEPDEVAPILLTPAQVLTSETTSTGKRDADEANPAEADHEPRPDRSSEQTLSPEPQWLDVEAWAATISALHTPHQGPATHALQLMPQTQKPAAVEMSGPPPSYAQELVKDELKTPLLADLDSDTVFTLIMAIIALAGLATLAFYP